MRVIKTLLAFIFLLGTAAVVAATLVLYLAVRGENAPALREVVSRFGRVVAGQHTEQMEIEVRVRPADENVAATARLMVRAEAGGRQHLYFLLNDGLRIQDVWQERANDERLPLSHYRLWLVTVVDLPRPLAKGESATIGIRYAGNPRRGGVDPGGAVLRPDGFLLKPEQLWYPSDLQGFFQVDAEVTLPADLTLLHNGREVKRVRQGQSQRIRFTMERPVGGLALVAGHFHAAGGDEEGDSHRVWLPDGVDLDGGRIAGALAASDRFLTGIYGPSGFQRLTVFVDRDLSRGFFDGTGLIGLPAGQFRAADYGFASIAHEVAHAWWGGTVGERWLDGGSGGQLIVEGFAELSSWLAVQDRLGDEALLRLLSERQYDPRRGGTLENLSALDNLRDPSSRETIYDKGGYVALMLRQRLGADVFASAARQFIDRFRYKSATDRDLQSVFGEVAKADLDDFFGAWVRSDRELDLSLDAQDGGAAVRNYGKAPSPAQIDLWRFPPGGEPERQSIAVDGTTPVGNVERLVLDPQALTADMYRANNEMPRHDDPRAVARSARGDLMVVYGQPYPWSPATVVRMDVRGERQNTWEFDQGLLSVPAWSADGTRILAAEVPAGSRPQLVALSATDGSRERVSYDDAGSGAGNGTYIARGPRLVRVSKGEKDLVLTEHPGRRIGSPLASPDGSRVAYAVCGGDRMDLRVVDSDGAHDRLLLTWNPGPLAWRWSPDGARLFAVLPGDWDWQLWEIPLEGDAPRDLVREAAGISDLAVAPDGSRVAIVAEPSLEYGRHRGEVFVIEPSSGDVQRFNLSGNDARSVAWLDGDSLLVVTADSTFPVLPEHRTLQRLRFSDGSLLPFP